MFDALCFAVIFGLAAYGAFKLGYGFAEWVDRGRM